MSEINRQLATVQRIEKLEKHPNADTLDIATIKGWNVIVKQGVHQEGDLVVYFEIDSFLPVEERYEFLRKNFKSTKNLGDGFRLRTMKLRDIVSQGLILPLSDFPEIKVYQEDIDVTKLLGVQKYEKPIPSNLQGVAKGNFPSFVPKTDQERVQNLTGRDYAKYGNDTFEVTTKLDGSSMTVYFNEGMKIGVCSRNWDLEDTEDNLYWQVFHKLNMQAAYNMTGNFALQGELVGPGVNNNYAKLTEHDFYLYDIYMIDGKRYMTPNEREFFFKNLLWSGVNIKHVPILHTNLKMPTKEEALEMADHQFNGLAAEGVVFKSNESQFSYKAISNKYLLKNDE